MLIMAASLLMLQLKHESFILFIMCGTAINLETISCTKLSMCICFLSDHGKS